MFVFSPVVVQLLALRHTGPCRWWSHSAGTQTPIPTCLCRAEPLLENRNGVLTKTGELTSQLLMYRSSFLVSISPFSHVSSSPSHPLPSLGSSHRSKGTLESCSHWLDAGAEAVLGQSCQEPRQGICSTEDLVCIL